MGEISKKWATSILSFKLKGEQKSFGKKLNMSLTSSINVDPCLSKQTKRQERRKVVSPNKVKGLSYVKLT